MKRKLLMAFVVMAWLVGAWAGAAAAAEIGYSMRSMEEDFSATGATKGMPSSAAVGSDALIGRPIGLGLTIAGAAVFAVTLPMSICSGQYNDAAWGLVGRPAGWTFCRPMGRSEPKYEERGVFGP
jgi:hypothetical protein